MKSKLKMVVALDRITHCLTNHTAGIGVQSRSGRKGKRPEHASNEPAPSGKVLILLSWNYSFQAHENTTSSMMEVKPYTYLMQM